MPGQILRDFNLIAVGEEVLTASILGVRVPDLNERILFVRAEFVDVDTGTEAAATLALTTTIAADGRSFNIYSWDQAGAASAVSRRVRWFAVVR
jgi:hypothetical protein